MKNLPFDNLVDSFFENPLLHDIIEEAIQSVESDDDPTPEQGNAAPEEPAEVPPGEDKLQKLAEDLKQGHLGQDDLINMYKAGQLSKEEIQQIVDLSAGTLEGGEAAPQEGGEVAPEQPSEEELFAQQIEQTNDMFIKFALYDKVSDLTSKLKFFSENFGDTESDMYRQVIQLKEFLNILSSLIFNLDTTVTYQMYGSLLFQLTELFSEYSVQETAQKTREQQIGNKKGLRYAKEKDEGRSFTNFN